MPGRPLISSGNITRDRPFRGHHAGSRLCRDGGHHHRGRIDGRLYGPGHRSGNEISEADPARFWRKHHGDDSRLSQLPASDVNRPSKVFAMPPRDDSRKGEVIRETLQMTEDQIRTKVVEFIKGAETVNLVDAEIIVSGAGGSGGLRILKSSVNWQTFSGCGRGISCSRRFGLDSLRTSSGADGRTVRPKIYIACGISGSIQHQAGMKHRISSLPSTKMRKLHF